jgi:hypothetical protein
MDYMYYYQECYSNQFHIPNMLYYLHQSYNNPHCIENILHFHYFYYIYLVDKEDKHWDRIYLDKDCMNQMDMGIYLVHCKHYLHND